MNKYVLSSLLLFVAMTLFGYSTGMWATAWGRLTFGGVAILTIVAFFGVMLGVYLFIRNVT